MAFVSAAAPLSRTRAVAQVSSRSAFAPRAARAAAPRARAATRMEFEISEGVSFPLNPAILGLAAAGWVLPSSIPAGIPLTGGAGLSPAFFASISANLARFPAGPAASDPFWTLCFLWHVGMFACMIFGTIGYNTRMQE